MILPLYLILSVFAFVAVADVNAALDTVCIAGQCLQGTFNLSVGATLAGPSSTRIILLPGQYASSNVPQSLHDALDSVSPSALAGFNLSSTSLPFTVSIEPGIVTYDNAFYESLASSFTPMVDNATTPRTVSGLQASSLIIGSNIWTALGSQSGGVSERLILWSSVPDMSQLPSASVGTGLNLLDLQFSTCSPPCSGAGTCMSSGQCACPTGFTGNSCETCASGFFGPQCLPCPVGCGVCDDGPTGSGHCLTAPALNTSASCNCLNGICLSSGQCQCNVGWGPGSNGTACSACAPGFFQGANGQCEVCGLECETCASGTGVCTTCRFGFTLDPTDNTQCVFANQLNPSTNCPDGAFYNGTGCAACSPLCKTCVGPLSDACVVCGAGRFSLNGTCVSVGSDGTCTTPVATSNGILVANNAKNECDACPSKCTKCGIPEFNVASTFSEVQCTGCLPGFVISQGQCVSQCPSGTFVSPTDNLTCAACDSTCSSCAGSSTYCLACSSSSQNALNGTCISSCPPGTFTSSGSCLPCHSDCATCSGSSFNECNSCPSSRPVMQASGQTGRCLPTCSQTEYFDPSSSACKSCDASCASCSGPGTSSCLACANSSEVLRSGTCVSSQCTSGTSVIQSLGVCLSDLVSVPSNSNNAASSSQPSSILTQRLAWWQILLMALGGAFVLLIVGFFWRRYARRQRAQETVEFAHAMDRKTFWRQRMRIVLGKKRRNGARDVARGIMLDPDDDLGDGDAIELDAQVPSSRRHSRSPLRRVPSIDSFSDRSRRESPSGLSSRLRASRGDPNLYSSQYPQPRQPLKDYSVQHYSTVSSAYTSSERSESPPRDGRSPSPGLPQKYQAYSTELRNQWLSPHSTGSSGQSNNPFRR